MALSYNDFEILLKLDDIKQFIYITKASIYKWLLVSNICKVKAR
jgi:hypothetical protein